MSPAIRFFQLKIPSMLLQVLILLAVSVFLVSSNFNCACQRDYFNSFHSMQEFSVDCRNLKY